MASAQALHFQRNAVLKKPLGCPEASCSAVGATSVVPHYRRGPNHHGFPRSFSVGVADSRPAATGNAVPSHKGSAATARLRLGIHHDDFPRPQSCRGRGACHAGAMALGCSSFMGQPMQGLLPKPPLQHKQQRRGPGVARAMGPLEIITGFAVAAGAMAVLTVPLTIAATLIAGTAAMVTGLIFAVLTPLLPLALASFGVFGVGLPFLWTALDKVLFLAVAFNFAFGVIGLATARRSGQRLGLGGVPREYRRSVPKRIRRMLSRQGLDPSSDASLAFDASLSSPDGSVPFFRKGFWLGPTLLSLLPGVHGASWLVAFSEWPTPAAPRWDMRLGLLRNALIYGGTGLLGLMFGHPFGAPVVTVAAKAQCWWFFCGGAKATTVVASTANGSFWLSLILGAVHLQLDRTFLRQLALSGSPGSAKKGVKGQAGGAVIDVETVNGRKEESPEELSKRELEDFDARLRYRTTGGALGENAAEWSTSEVALWLEDSGFSEHTEAFQDHDISGAVLLSLTEAELREELGMERLGQRKRLLLLIQQLRK